MIKFENELVGYGFDVQADRVVRFNKHPDGTYLNTRATYSINKLQFTHYDLRVLALKLMKSCSPVASSSNFNIKPKWIFRTFAVILIATMMTNCTFDFSSNVSIDTQEQEQEQQ
jgi:hypothetical protein